MKEQLTAGFPCLQHCPGSGTKLCVLTFAWFCRVTKAQACWQDVYVEGRAPGRALIRECVEPEVPFLTPLELQSGGQAHWDPGTNALMFPELRLLHVTVCLADVSDVIAMNVAQYKISLLLYLCIYCKLV